MEKNFLKYEYMSICTLLCVSLSEIDIQYLRKNKNSIHIPRLCPRLVELSFVGQLPLYFPQKSLHNAVYVSMIFKTV